MPRFDDFCEVHLGFKSLMNDFFYVDETTVNRFSIEDEYLTPIFMLADLDDGRVSEKPQVTRWLFNCKKEPTDLRGTGAHDYIDWGAKQETRAKKQAKEVVTWKAALEKQGQKHWWWPAQPPTLGRLFLRKGYGSRYAPFRFGTPRLLDQRLYRIAPRPKVKEAAVLAYLCSSYFPLALETNADLGLGAGVLTVGTRSLQALPTLDLAALGSASSFGDVQEALLAVVDGPALNATEYPKAAELRALDEAILTALGHDPSDASEAADAMAQLAQERLTRSGLREKTRTASSKADLAAVAAPIVDRLLKWWSARAFPDDFLPQGDSIAYAFPSEPLSVEITYMLGEADLCVRSGPKVVVEQTVSLYVAELVLRCLQLGRRSFDVPEDPSAAAECLANLDNLLDQFERAFIDEIDGTSLGARFDNAVRSHVLRQLHIQLSDLRHPLNSSSTWAIESLSGKTS